jgi:hypothetical protein
LPSPEENMYEILRGVLQEGSGYAAAVVDLSPD